MKISIDQTQDYSHQELYSFLDSNTIPQFVKEGELITKEAADKLAEPAFADRYHRAFPIDSAANCYVSNAFFINKKAALKDMWGANYITEVESRLNKAAELFEISNDVNTYNTNLLVKTAADYQEKFVSYVQANESDYELFPYKTAADVGNHARLFAKDIKNYPFNWRTKIAADFVKVAVELGVEELPDLVCKYAGYYFPDTRNFATELTRRMNKISNEKAKEGYKELITKAASVESREAAFNLCKEGYELERTAGVYDNVSLSNSLGDIVDKTFTLDFQKIAGLLDVVNMDGEPYAMSDLKKVNKEIFKQAFGCDINTSDDAELRNTLEVMPRSDIALFRELSGVRSL